MLSVIQLSVILPNYFAACSKTESQQNGLFTFMLSVITLSALLPNYFAAYSKTEYQQNGLFSFMLSVIQPNYSAA
jgi:hypothetical protein